MVKPLVPDPLLLARKSLPATPGDLSAADDLMDTLLAHRDSCVGMAANMIGVQRRIIVFFDGSEPVLMLNPRLLRGSGPYEAQEGCLSLLGGPRPARRYQKIKVEYQTRDFKTRLKTYEGFPAQIIQHELDHCDGILI